MNCNLSERHHSHDIGTLDCGEQLAACRCEHSLEVLTVYTSAMHLGSGQHGGTANALKACVDIYLSGQRVLVGGCGNDKSLQLWAVT